MSQHPQDESDAPTDSVSALIVLMLGRLLRPGLSVVAGALTGAR